MDDSGIGERIAAMRHARGWTQADLAEATGFSPSTIAKIEQGGQVWMSTYQRVADVLGAQIAFVPSGSALADTMPVKQRRQALRSPASLGEAFCGRLVQIALDLPDLDRAVEVADLAVQANTDLLEVGDPLIKRFGMEAVRRIRAAHPTIPLVAELSSSDWADEQVRLAADAGADIVMLLGLRQAMRIERAVSAARACGVGIVVGLPPEQEAGKWCRAAHGHGVDAISVIRNIDASSTVADSFRQVRAVRRATNLPVAVSGGFTPDQVADAISLPWNVVIVGRAVVEAPSPGRVVEKLVQTVHGRG